MLIKNFRDIFALIYVTVFCLWLALVAFFYLPMVISNPESLDPALAIVTALGVGAVTQFLIVIGTIIYQFYFRRATETETLPK